MSHANSTQNLKYLTSVKAKLLNNSSLFIKNTAMHVSPADMSKNHALCEVSTKFGTVIVLDEAKKNWIWRQLQKFKL
jgi:hypothetical protein